MAQVMLYVNLGLMCLFIGFKVILFVQAVAMACYLGIKGQKEEEIEAWKRESKRTDRIGSFGSIGPGIDDHIDKAREKSEGLDVVAVFSPGAILEHFMHGKSFAVSSDNGCKAPFLVSFANGNTQRYPDTSLSQSSLVSFHRHRVQGIRHV
jgi:hypothetical protein